MRVKGLAQEHNTVLRPGLEPGPFNPESSTLTLGHRASHILIVNCSKNAINLKYLFCDRIKHRK